jgi:hypothetical protein
MNKKLVKQNHPVLSCWLLLALSLFATISLSSLCDAKGVAQGAPTAIDADLKKLPLSYQRRIQQFRNIIRAQTTKDEKQSKEAKLKKALQLASDPRSPYRKDAIRFIVDVKAVETTPQLIALAKRSPFLRDEVVVAMSLFKTKEAIDYLIECLNDTTDLSGFVRSIAINGLRNITNQDFAYRYDAPPAERLKAYQTWKEWWAAKRETFQKVERNKEEQEEADEMWKRYGQRYLN